MHEIDCLSVSTDWIDLNIVERERTPERIIEVGIQLYLARLSLLNTKQYLETLGVERSSTTGYKKPTYNRPAMRRRITSRSTRR